MEGLDDIGLTLRHVDQIDAFEAQPAVVPAEDAASKGCQCELVRSTRGSFPYKTPKCASQVIVWLRDLP